MRMCFFISRKILPISLHFRSSWLSKRRSLSLYRNQRPDRYRQSWLSRAVGWFLPAYSARIETSGRVKSTCFGTSINLADPFPASFDNLRNFYVPKRVKMHNHRVSRPRVSPGSSLVLFFLLGKLLRLKQIRQKILIGQAGVPLYTLSRCRHYVHGHEAQDWLLSQHNTSCQRI